jgi:ABC-type multidrug transport system ATPase subunit
MNKLINKYLAAMDFYVSFELDEAFNEIIKSRHRDEFTYASFSEGEKMRIDLAILFTWRQIAKMKNSVNTNLLILDEVFDSSLDTTGTDYFLSIMNSFGDNTNVFVISHKGDILVDKFHSVIKFEKKNDFSVMTKA